MVEEAGMQPLEADVAQHSAVRQAYPHLPLLGASPDALVRWPDGRVEVRSAVVAIVL